MSVGRKIEDEREAVRCLRAAARKGMSTGAWARAHGFDGRSLHAWQMNIERRGTTAPVRRRKIVPKVSSAHALVELVPAATSAVQGPGRYAVVVGALGSSSATMLRPRRCVGCLRRCGPAEPAAGRSCIRGSYAARHARRRLTQSPCAVSASTPSTGTCTSFSTSDVGSPRRCGSMVQAGACLRSGLRPAQLPPLDGDKPQIAIDGSTFASLLAGIDFTAARSGWYRRPQLEKVEKTIDTDRQV